MSQPRQLLAAQQPNFAHWEIIKDVVDQLIDLMLDARQSGHPGGSRSKAHMLLSLLLGGAMRWDVRDPSKRFADRFVLVAGHCSPLIYAVLATFHEALRVAHAESGDPRYTVHGGRARTLTWEDLHTLRHRRGLPGHVEMAGKNLFCKWNTGPSGHGAPAAVGQALALKKAGCDGVKVFAMEGEGGHTAGVWHESKNAAYGLGLDNLNLLLDWNDFGIDPRPYSSVVHGDPRQWFEPYGWHVHAAPDGSDWTAVTRAIFELTAGANPAGRPGLMYGRTRKGRGYHTYDEASHGAAHKYHSEKFWRCRRDFAEKYGVEWEGEGQDAPATAQAKRDRLASHLNTALDVLRGREVTLRYLADRLVELGESVPRELATFKLPDAHNPLEDPDLFDVKRYPADLWAKPGAKQPNRAGFARWGSWVNSTCLKRYGRPLFVVTSADLAGSTNIEGFGKDYSAELKNVGWYDRDANVDGVVLPQPITEFANAGITAGCASVNLAADPESDFNGWYTACSTYGSFSYLKYGAFRLFSQLAQECELRVGKAIWVAGHSGPETAEDSRTHFGVFSPGVTQLFPEGHVLNLVPWEYNEVAPMLAAAMRCPQPIVILHLTRPAVEIPDRAALGLGSHLLAARGAYILRPYRPGLPRQGCVFVQGTMSTTNLVKALAAVDAAGVNLKIVAVPSRDLFRMQDQEYQDTVVTKGDRLNSTYATNMARRCLVDWSLNPLADDWALSSDRDNRWRDGGSVDEVMLDAQLDPESIATALIEFGQAYEQRMKTLGHLLAHARGESH
ncbi:MAG TPA: transketolase [Candidatus Krumholzibacteria bacterium]|nr:transketolase [Candidatus Krumholzibacteria bacterium]HPD72392.1 transketolase [Candidatus Krumholzibacteria bacterium]HRY40676.1 transketolase [Candidatus Krumholzibacteria bacterium]